MTYPTRPDFPHETLDSGGRLYRLRGHARLFALWYPGPLPHAPDGAFIYAFLEGDRAGNWNWAQGAEGLTSVMEAFNRGTDPEYSPPEHQAPGGEPSQLRPPTQDLLERAIEKARPDHHVPDISPDLRRSGIYVD